MDNELFTMLGVFLILLVGVTAFWKWRKSKKARKNDTSPKPPIDEDEARGI